MTYSEKKALVAKLLDEMETESRPGRRPMGAVMAARPAPAPRPPVRDAPSSDRRRDDAATDAVIARIRTHDARMALRRGRPPVGWSFSRSDSA